MDRIVEQMLKQYDAQTVFEKKNAIKEVIQEIVLCGLSRAKFFRPVAFYGGTALRIFYGLDRFSEDLDFSLKTADPLFELSDYLPILEKEIRSFGLNFKIEVKEKTADSDIKSAFLKANTKELLLMLYPEQQFIRSTNSGELIKVKFEVDTNPPDFASFETKYRLLPIPYDITLCDMPSLFAGKIHAVICRAWKNRVKGRDLYDYVFYLSRGISVNLKHLSARLEQTNYIPHGTKITIGEVKDILRKKFSKIDYAQARQDVVSFIKNPSALDVWNTEFFCEITDNLKEMQ